MEVFESRDNRLLGIFSQQQPRDRLVCVLPVLDGIERLKRVFGLQCVEQVEDGRDDVFQRRIELHDLAGHLLANRSRIVAIGDLEIEIPQQFYDRKIRCRVTI